jgi:predicted choloylglycine hydrolase
MMARNFDYPYGTALIMHTIPDEGYESITTFSTDFFGFGENYKPEGFRNQYMALTGLFMALDGLNEKGLAIAVLDAGDKVVTHQSTSKPDLTTTTAVQYLLKNAANIDEALVLLRSIDMNSDPGSAYHLSMADATGRSVAVEYVDNNMVVTESPFLTNHYLCEAKFLTGLHEGDHRHEKLMEQYDASNGVMNAKKLTETIASVTQLPEKGAIVGGTLWTMVMDLSHPSVTYYSLRHFDKPFHFELCKQREP